MQTPLKLGTGRLAFDNCPQQLGSDSFIDMSEKVTRIRITPVQMGAYFPVNMSFELFLTLPEFKQLFFLGFRKSAVQFRAETITQVRGCRIRLIFDPLQTMPERILIDFLLGMPDKRSLDARRVKYRQSPPARTAMEIYGQCLDHVIGMMRSRYGRGVFRSELPQKVIAPVPRMRLARLWSEFFAAPFKRKVIRLGQFPDEPRVSIRFGPNTVIEMSHHQFFFTGSYKFME